MTYGRRDSAVDLHAAHLGGAQRRCALRSLHAPQCDEAPRVAAVRPLGKLSHAAAELDARAGKAADTDRHVTRL